MNRRDRRRAEKFARIEARKSLKKKTVGGHWVEHTPAPAASVELVNGHVCSAGCSH